MTFDETWAKVVEANPKLRGERVDMTPANFKKVMGYAFEQGATSARGEDLFGKMFGNCEKTT